MAFLIAGAALLAGIYIFQLICGLLANIGGQDGPDWRITDVWRGLQIVADKIRLFADGVTWRLRAVKWPWTPPKPHPTVALLHEADAAGEPVVAAQALIGIQNEIGVLVQRGDDRSPDETHRLLHLREHVRAFEGRVVAEAEGTAVQPFMAPTGMGWAAKAAASQFLVPGLLVIGGLFVTGWGAAALNGFKADRFERQRDSARADAETYRLGFTQAKGRLDEAYSRVTKIQAKCVAELENTAQTANTLQKRIAAIKKQRAKDEEALVSGGAPVALGDVLRDVFENRTAAPPAPATPDGSSGVPIASGGEAASGQPEIARSIP